MKLISGLSALLLGTALLANNAFAQNDDNGHVPPPHPLMDHAPPPPHAPAGQTNGQFAGHPYWRGNPNFSHSNNIRAGQNRARWNHVVAFHDHNVAHFNVQDRALWTHGNWHHTLHNGRNGWWWYTNGAWFLYDQPVYPYPAYVSDEYSFDDEGYDDAGPGNGGGYVWYYCNNPAGYYPYIQSCRGPWQPVDPNSYRDQGQQQGGPDVDDEEDNGGPPPGNYRGPDNDHGRGQFQGQPGGPPPGYDNGQGGGDGDQGPPPGYGNGQRPYDGNDQGPPPGYYDQQPPPR